VHDWIASRVVVCHLPGWPALRSVLTRQRGDALAGVGSTMASRYPCTVYRNGSNVIPRRARPGLAGLRPHRGGVDHGLGDVGLDVVLAQEAHRRERRAPLVVQRVVCHTSKHLTRRMRKSRPDSGHGFQVKVLRTFKVVPSSLGNGFEVRRAPLVVQRVVCHTSICGS